MTTAVFPIGWYFTDIALTNMQALINQVTNTSSVTNIVSGNLADSATNGLINFTINPPPYYYVITNPPTGPEPLVSISRISIRRRSCFS